LSVCLWSDDVMKTAPLFLILALAGSIAVGCSNNPAALPANGSPQVTGTDRTADAARTRPNDCGWFCPPEIIAPLAYDGSTFSIARMESCHDVLHAPIYTAPSSAPLTLPYGEVTLPPTCANNAYGRGGDAKRSNRGWPSQTPKQLYVIALHFPGWSHDRSVDAQIAAHPRDLGDFLTFVAGPAAIDGYPWNFYALLPGLTFEAGGKYVFYIAAIANGPTAEPSPTPTPVPTPTPLDYTLVAPLQYDGTTFSVPSTFNPAYDCSSVSATTAPAYTAPASGLFPLSVASDSLAPICGPQTVAVRIIAVQVAGAPSSGSVPGWSIMGPVPTSSNPWVFKPNVNFVEVSGTQYAFFIASGQVAPQMRHR
jgi:hypothetical protein